MSVILARKRIAHFLQMNASAPKEVAETILEQLGGGKFLSMTGAKNLMQVANPHGLQFDLPKGTTNKANKVQIRINGKDLYDITFFRYIPKDLELRKLSTHEDIDAANLRKFFTEQTGLHTSL